MDRSRHTDNSQDGRRQPAQPPTSSIGASYAHGRQSQAAQGGLPPLFPSRSRGVLPTLSDVRRPRSGTPSAPGQRDAPPLYNVEESGPISRDVLLHPVATPPQAYYTAAHGFHRPVIAGEQRGRPLSQPALDLNLLASTAADVPPASLLLETPEEDEVPCPPSFGPSQVEVRRGTHASVLGHNAAALPAANSSLASAATSPSLPQRAAQPQAGEPAAAQRRMGLVTPVLQERLAAVSAASGSRTMSIGASPPTSSSLTVASDQSAGTSPRQRERPVGTPVGPPAARARPVDADLSPEKVIVRSRARRRGATPGTTDVWSLPPRTAGSGTPRTAASAFVPTIAEAPPVRTGSPPPPTLPPVASSSAPPAPWDGLMPSPPAPRPLRPRTRKRAATPSQGVAAEPSLRLADVLEVGASAAEYASPGASGFSGPSQGVQLTEAAGGLIKEAVSKGLRDGLRGVHSELAGLRKAYDSMSATLNILCTTVNNQGVGSERTAQALQRLQGAVRGGFSSLVPATDALSHADCGEALAAPLGAAAAAAAPALPNKKWVDLPLAEKQKVASRNLDTLSSVRDMCKETLVNTMISSDVSAEALPDAVETKEHVHAAVRAVLNVAEDDVQTYLDSSLFFPARQLTSEPVTARVSSKLGLVLPHLLQGLRRHIVPVYFKKLRVSLSEIDKAVSDQWIEDNKYTN